MNNKKDEILKGLTSAEAEELLKKWGPNLIEKKVDSMLKKILKKFFSPVSIMLLAAAVLSLVSGDVFNFFFILALILVNYLISFWQEYKADSAVAKLNEEFRVKVNTLRDDKWVMVDSEWLVPGDIIEITVGDIIPADIIVKEATNLFINEASLTGESLAQEKSENSQIYSGAYVETGEGVALVEKTGNNTYFGKTIAGAEKATKRSILESDILNISKFISSASLIGVIIVTWYFLHHGFPAMKIITADLSLIIAGVPVALPTVMTLIISIGVVRLSQKKVIVRRLSSLENLANVNVLFTDKTGTLTENKIKVERVVSYGGSEKDVLYFAYGAVAGNSRDVINTAIIDAFKSKFTPDFKIENFITGDSKRKRSSAVLVMPDNKVYATVGAPQVIIEMCSIEEAAKKKVENDVLKAAEGGYRVLLVAVNPNGTEETSLKLFGAIFLSDPLRVDAADTIEFLRKNGVEVNMVTGDHGAIGKRIGKEIGLKENEIYCEVLPDDKYNLVVGAKKSHVVAVTGDGVNDLPAVRSADVGIAVSNSVDALKSAADIFLLSPGISVITEAIVESRKIFSRLNSYAIYRISESFRIVVTIVVLSLGYHFYLLTPIQLIVLALLNDIPIVSLAFNKVKNMNIPAKIEAKKRIVISLLFGMVGVLNSALFVFILRRYFDFGWDVLSTAFFLKLTVSGHLLLFVAHTEDRWYRFLPSKQVIAAILFTQLTATIIAFGGIVMNAVSLSTIIFVWIWSIVWMQISEFAKDLRAMLIKT